MADTADHGADDDALGLIDRVDEFVLRRTSLVLVAFLVLTLVFGAGLGNIGTESGTDEFTADVPAQEALEDINREFGSAFPAPTGSTQLLQDEQNVLGKPALLRMLETQRALTERSGLRVIATSSPARSVARQLDPRATTLDAQIEAVERATPAQIDRAVRRAAERDGFASSLSNDFNAEAASASAAIGVVTHSTPGASATGAGGPGGGGASLLTEIQLESQRVVAVTAGDSIRVFGSGLINDEFGRVIFDSLGIVIPAAALFILLFLVIAYRDPFDLVLGVCSLLMAIVWTFGFTGLVGIPFSQLLVAVPPLLLAVGIDFGIHAINRYREERVQGVGRDESMRVTLRQLLVAFFIVTGTTVIGFGANGTSSLGPIRQFGVVAAVGIIFTFLVFGVFLPAAKLWTDRRRDRYNLPSFATNPLGAEDSLLGRVLPVGVHISRRAPVVFLVLVLLLTAGSAYYATGVDTSFNQEDFLPPEETPAYLDSLPEPFRPGEYTVTRDLNFLEDNFEAGNQQSVTVYMEGPMERDTALATVHRGGVGVPEEFIAAEGTDERRIQAQSVVTVIQSYSAQDPRFARLVEQNDVDGDGVPDRNLGEVYEYLESSPAAPQLANFLADDHRSTRVVYTAKGDVGQAELTAAGERVAARHERAGFDATATGQTIVFQAVSDVILNSALTSLVLALGLTAVFLVVVYRVITGFAALGIVNLVPIVVTVSLVAGSMRLFGIPFNALTATILSITIGLGIDYSVHVVHRFADEFEERPLFEALERTVRGTGGALTGSMLTTVTGIGVLVLAITPILGQFGILTGLSVFYAYLTSVVITPSAVVVWDRIRGGRVSVPSPVGAD